MPTSVRKKQLPRPLAWSELSLGVDMVTGRRLSGTKAEITRRQIDLHRQLIEADDRARTYLKLEGQIRTFFPKEADRVRLLRNVAFSKGVKIPFSPKPTEEMLYEKLFNKKPRKRERVFITEKRTQMSFKI